MPTRFVILSPGDPRPDSSRIIFCDGSGGRLYRPKDDLELSHWRPNQTPREYRADTSTEICFRFIESHLAGDWTLAVNNHLDVDGILSVYVLMQPEQALLHRRTIIDAAEIGDFWGWGGPTAQRLFQGLTRLIDSGTARQIDSQIIYEQAFALVPALISGEGSESALAQESLEPLRRGVALIEQGAIWRAQLGPRFSRYAIPRAIFGDELESALYVPGFNEVISDKALVWPQARARWDAERICLVSVEARDGWFHNLWFPGYLWADTENRWTVPGMRYRDGMESYELDHPALTEAVHRLQNSETADGTWALGDGASPFNKQLAGIFPVVLRFSGAEGRPAASRLDPAQVAAELQPAFADP
ncbi:MAG: DUF6687 family protein [Planctomycetaceae bacterium]